MNFMHFHNSFTRNCNNHILLIMTGNAHKEFCRKLLLILVREQGLYIIKTDCSGKMVVAFTIKEISYLVVSLFYDVVLPLSYLYCGIGFTIGLVSGIATKPAIVLSIFSFTNCSGYGL